MENNRYPKIYVFYKCQQSVSKNIKMQKNVPDIYQKCRMCIKKVNVKTYISKMLTV